MRRKKKPDKPRKKNNYIHKIAAVFKGNAAIFLSTNYCNIYYFPSFPYTIVIIKTESATEKKWLRFFNVKKHRTIEIFERRTLYCRAYRKIKNKARAPPPIFGSQKQSKIKNSEEKKMKDNAKCFVLTADGYEEINYTTFAERSKRDPSYQKRKFIPLHGMLMEVSEADYKAFYKGRRRQKYLREISEQNEDISYNMLTTDEFNGEDILVSPEPALEEQAIKNIMLDKLCGSLLQLSEDEISLIRALYFRCLSEREYSAETGIPQKTINNRKRKLLTRLKNILEK